MQCFSIIPVCNSLTSLLFKVLKLLKGEVHGHCNLKMKSSGEEFVVEEKEIGRMLV